MPEPPKSELVRAMGRWTLVALVINSIIGSGIFGLPSLVWKLVGSASPWAYLIAGAGIGVIMACFAEVASRFTEAGGPYLYARAAFGRFLGIEMAWLLWLVRLSACAAGANLFVIYLAEFWPGAKQPLARALVLTALLGVLAAINYRGVKSGASMSNVFTVAKLVPLGLFVLAGGVFLLWRGTAASPSTVHPVVGDWLQATLVLMFAYGGFEGAMVPLAEAKDPRRDAPFALLVSLVVCVALFTLVQIVVQGTLADPGQIDRPLAAAARQFLGAAGARFISLGALVSLYGYLSANMLNTPRLTFALAEQDDFPRIFRAIHPRFRTPYVSIVVFAALVWVLAVIGNFRWNVVLSAVARLFAYGAVCAAMLVLNRRQPNEARFPLPAPPLFGILGIAFALALVSRMGRAELVIIAGTMLIALLNWLWARGRGKCK
jgi:basic amino acid/polyamine antiporter, APA family